MYHNFFSDNKLIDQFTEFSTVVVVHQKLANELEFYHVYSHANGAGVGSIRNAKLSTDVSDLPEPYKM
jgi:hypothetical protein